MKKLQKFFALTAIMTMVASSGFSQEYYDEGVAYDEGIAFEDGANASRMSTLVPVGALVVAAVLIAATHRHRNHGGRGGIGGPASSHAHSH